LVDWLEADLRHVVGWSDAILTAAAYWGSSLHFPRLSSRHMRRDDR
jgi:hypothetical protein